MKQKVIRAVLIGVLLFLCFSMAEKIERCYSALGLRWKNPLTQTQAETLRKQAAEQNLTLSFWQEEVGQVTSALHSMQNVTVIKFNGEGAPCYPAELVTGSYPGSEDVFGCSISTSLAWELFGSDDLVGQQLKWNERVLTVRGVFSERADVLLVADEMTGTFTAAELGGALEEDRRTQAQTLVQQAGLPAPDSMIYGQSMYTLALWFCYLPMVLASVFWIKGCERRIRALPSVHRQVLWWGVGMGTALCLPFLLSLLPVWMIPARWSDFSFWPTLLQTGGQCIDEWLALVPAHKDVLAKRAECLLVLFSAIASGITIGWYNKTRTC